MTDREVLTLPFGERWVSNLVGRYNQCVEPAWKPNRAETSTSQVSFGINAGLTYSFLASGDGSGQADQDLRPGGLLGMELHVLRSNGWWLSSGLALQQLRGGYKPYSVYTGTPLFTDMRSRSYTLNSLVLQGKLGRSFGQPGQLRPFVYVTAAGGYMFSSHSNVRDEYSNSFYPDKNVRTDESDRFNAQFGGGLGMWVPLSSRHDLQVSVQYSQLTIVSIPSTLRNRIATLQIGYKFSSL
ncbi:outer membrane beta-barrel protein [Hymenobacter taeanensis]|uniref:Outer membrane beta-barrel protein n=2 Tax=Hymenobacteraceae TaxID=1853232 RepID=A0A6M6BBP2_9BACT|nr:outer membrane beta-barrel protein [Hymenobacter sp. 5414T-23]QJX45419.1 outer membrane beta-barrel protein [Hymenobacter taeanensis]